MCSSASRCHTRVRRRPPRCSATQPRRLRSRTSRSWSPTWLAMSSARGGGGEDGPLAPIWGDGHSCLPAHTCTIKVQQACMRACACSNPVNIRRCFSCSPRMSIGVCGPSLGKRGRGSSSGCMTMSQCDRFRSQRRSRQEKRGPARRREQAAIGITSFCEFYPNAYRAVVASVGTSAAEVAKYRAVGASEWRGTRTHDEQLTSRTFVHTRVLVSDPEIIRI